MPKYSYQAINLSSQKVNGQLDARDEEDLRRILRAQELIPTKYSILEDDSTRYRMKAKDVAEFSRQITSMLSSGITIVRAMEILKERDFHPSIIKIYEKIHRDVLMGYTLSEAMRLQPRAFPELLVNMYASGEASGQLENVTDKMAAHYEKEHKLNAKVKAAMTYPIVLLVTTIGAVMLLFTLILPNFFELFEGMDDMPMITVIMLDVSDFMINWWYMVLIAILVLMLAVQLLLQNPKIRYGFDRLKLKLPVVGKLLIVIYTARFGRTLSSLYSSGIPMIRALEITATIVNNEFIAAQFPDIINDVRNGQPLASSIAKVDGFDKKLATTIMIGEESGRLDAMLESTAEAFDYEAEMAMDKLVELIQPVMILVLAVGIGSVLLAVMLPMMEMYNNIDGIGGFS
ncbi:MAG: type II secretion system F family protein [Oscillospiraceae bacterium]|jgi:type IV pilus assembly protein PilC|nr:type II secretion system F family protein [Oscillospiraceae bacterium]